jgi:sugar lactone lactonase YvrE
MRSGEHVLRRVPKTIVTLLVLLVCEIKPATAKGDIIYALNYGVRKIVKINSTGVITPFANVGTNVGGLSIDSHGTLYCASFFDAIDKLTPNGNISAFTVPGLKQPTGIAFDSADNLYVSNFGTSSLLKISPTLAVTTVATGLSYPEGVAVDHIGNVYVACHLTGTVVKVAIDGSVTTFATGLAEPDAVAIDSNNNLYVNNSGGKNILKLTPDGVISTFASGLPSLAGLTIDSTNNVYASNYIGNIINRITPDGTVSIFASGLTQPSSLYAQAIPEPSSSVVVFVAIGLTLMQRKRSFTRTNS